MHILVEIDGTEVTDIRVRESKEKVENYQLK